MHDPWERLHETVRTTLRPCAEGRFIAHGGVAAAIETGSGRICRGVSVDTACTLGICAERNALFHMLTHGETEVRRVLVMDAEGRALPPCGACREFIAQLMPQTYRAVEIMLDYPTRTTATLGELLPHWWGTTH